MAHWKGIHVDGPVSVPAAGTHDFWFTFPADSKPMTIDMVAAQCSTMAAGGGWITLYLVRGQQYMVIERTQITNDYPYMIYNAPFVMEPGDKLKCRFYNLTAADTIEWTVRGH